MFPEGLPLAKLPPNSSGACEVHRVGLLRTSKRNFAALWGVPPAQLSPSSWASERSNEAASNAHPDDEISRAHGGLPLAQLSPLSWGPGMSSVAVSYAHPEDTSKLPGGGASTCATVATFKGSWEAQRSSVLCTRIRNIASPRGAATCAVVAISVDSWEVQRDLAAPWRAATCATVAAILRSWEVQQGGV